MPDCHICIAHLRADGPVPTLPAMNTQAIDPVPPSAWPTFQPVTTPLPAMPTQWVAAAILQPFSPPQSNDPKPTTPFFELCVAKLTSVQGVYFSAQITGCAAGLTWWYLVEPYGTYLSRDGGTTWKQVDMG